MNTYSKNRLSKIKTPGGSSKEKGYHGKNDQPLSYPYFHVLAFLLITFTAIVVYSHSFDSSFHLDDESNIIHNPQLTSLSHFWNFYYWVDANRPLAYFSFALNYYFGKLDVFGYHIVNLAIHIIAGFFVFLLATLIIDFNNYKHEKSDKYKYWFALFAALLFVVHPLQTQAIIYIVQRMASLAAMFYIISIYWYAKGRIEHVQNNKTHKALVYYLLALMCGIFGVMTKQNAVTFPLAFLLFEFMFIRNKGNRLFSKYIILSFSIMVVVFILFFFAKKETFILALHDTKITSVDYLITQFVVLVKYLQLTILPINQCADYGNIHYAFPTLTTFWRWDVLGCFLILIGLFASAAYVYKKNKALSFGVYWFFLTLSIESSIIPIADPMVNIGCICPWLEYA
jgi:protein O-mannosyl-transferase